jgi:hypothetical protein
VVGILVAEVENPVAVGIHVAEVESPVAVGILVVVAAPLGKQI